MSADEQREYEEAQNRAKRIERWHRTGCVFQSTPDLRWLYIELALANGGTIDWKDEDRLKKFVAEPTWGSVINKNSNNVDELLEQGGIFVENTKFHCTTLRDYFLRRLVWCLNRALEQKLDKIKARKLVWDLIPIAIICGVWAYNFWAALTLAALYGLKKLSDQRKFSRLICQRVIASSIEDVVNKGGFDELDVIRSLDILKEKYDCEFIPSVVYALLRLPRRNVEHDVSKAYQALDDSQKKVLWNRWEKFVGEMVNYDDGEAARKTYQLEINECANAIAPLRESLDKLAKKFVNESNIVFEPGGGLFIHTYSINVIHPNDKGHYSIYIRCEKINDGLFHYPTRVEFPNSSNWVHFQTGNNEKIVGVIDDWLSFYLKHLALSPDDVKRIKESVKEEA